MHPFIEKYQTIIIRVIVGLGILLGLLFLGLTLNAFKEHRFIGSGLSATNTITVTGQGKVEKAPDTAKISFSIRNEQKDLKTAQSTVSTKVDAIKKALMDAGLEEKYIKTESYTSYPQYDYPQIQCFRAPCPQSNPSLRGYEVSQNISLAIKDLDKVETVLGILGTNGVTDMSGPSFGFEDDKAVAREARNAAIDDAKDEAQKLAKALGVHLVRIVSFSEQGSGYPMPYAAKLEMSRDAVAGSAAPSIPVGVQNVQTTVSVVYEIR